VAVAPCGSGASTVTDPLNAAGLANGGELYEYTDWACRSGIDYLLYDAAVFRGRSYLEGGLKLGYRAPTGIEAFVFARNILNQIRIVSAIDFNNLTGMLNEPPIIGVELRAAF
jgi:iron complex outermembrane receptor protein